MTFALSQVGAGGVPATGGLSTNGALAAQDFLNALLGQQDAPRSGGEAFLADVKEAKTPTEKRALIDGFAEGFAAASGQPAASGKAAPATKDAAPAAKDSASRPDAAAQTGSAEAAPEAGAGDDAASPLDLMQGFQEIAGKVAESDLPKAAKNLLLDGIAGLMSKLKNEAPSDEKACGSPASSPAGAASAREATGSASGSASADEAASGGSSSGASSSGTWSHEVEDGKATINLGDKYTITAEENGESWTVKNNETGQSTRIHGDPHVDVNNDGKNDFDFKKDMTFQLDDGTKITVNTVPGGENGTTFSSRLTITNGDKALEVSGLGGDHDGKNNLAVRQSNAGATLDDLTNDGTLTVYENGGSWRTKDGEAVDQAVINAAEADA